MPRSLWAACIFLDLVGEERKRRADQISSNQRSPSPERLPDQGKTVFSKQGISVA
jgi:hypothetical protein